MAWLTPSSRFTILALPLSLWLAVNVATQAIAQSLPESLSSKVENAFSPPQSDPPAPDNTQAGGTRGICVKDNQPFRALVPASRMGETLAEHPTVFWYMPPVSPELAPDPAVEFVLKDATGKSIYSFTYRLEKSATGVVGGSSIMNLTIPASPEYPSLEIGQEYSWDLRLRCDAKDPDRSADPTESGRMKRVPINSTMALRLQKATPQERVALYADARLWYEMLNSLMELRRDRPNDKEIADAWNKLFNLVGLITSSEERIHLTRSQGQTPKKELINVTQ
jgi:hypothetical protein